jgi:hypothetical protein
MEEEDAVFTDVEQAIRDRIDDELVNHELMERLDHTVPAQLDEHAGRTRTYSAVALCLRSN